MCVRCDSQLRFLAIIHVIIFREFPRPSISNILLGGSNGRKMLLHAYAVIYIAPSSSYEKYAVGVVCYTRFILLSYRSNRQGI